MAGVTSGPRAAAICAAVPYSRPPTVITPRWYGATLIGMDIKQAEAAEAAEILRRILADPGELVLTVRQQGYLAGAADTLRLTAGRGGRTGSRG